MLRPARMYRRRDFQ